MRLKDKIAIITGSTRGIGLAIASEFARQGAIVFISSRKEENVAKALRELQNQFPDRIYGKALHIGMIDQHAPFVQFVTETAGTPDILVNNDAANPYFGPMLNLEWAAWDKTVQVNLKGAFGMSRETAKRSIEAKKALSIVNVSSIFGMMPCPHQGIYGMTKAALISMTKTLAHEWAPHSIRVNAIAPGLVNTHFASAIVQNPQLSAMYTSRAAQ
ncbi:MAG: SDR family NAD(P)-dependent oxidoreductase, partial [Myxococcota bacterium]|nr:SDR family NAD(P)-dependent oxidoreductase [Myxococcota bacterium]